MFPGMSLKKKRARESIALLRTTLQRHMIAVQTISHWGVDHERVDEKDSGSRDDLAAARRLQQEGGGTTAKQDGATARGAAEAGRARATGCRAGTRRRAGNTAARRTGRSRDYVRGRSRRAGGRAGRQVRR